LLTPATRSADALALKDLRVMSAAIGGNGVRIGGF
jgi:hypothetical protein